MMTKTSQKTLKYLVLATCLAITAGCATTGEQSAAESADVGADVSRERTILSAINDDPGINGQNIGISCVNGVVTLRGTVQSQLERQLAEKIASGVEGVKSVNNLLTFS